jgi:hypothetical protein
VTANVSSGFASFVLLNAYREAVRGKRFLLLHNV